MVLEVCGARYLVAASVALAPLTASAAVEPRIAFERGDSIWIANRDGSSARKVAAGSFPAISPDGIRIAFNTSEKTGDTYVHHIAVLDIASGKTNTFKEVPSTNSYYATWSPDGGQILFTLRAGNVWDLGIIKADGTNFQTVKKGTEKEVTPYSPTWARDGQSIFCQDMTNIYRLDLKGNTVAQWKIETIIPKGNMSGDGRIAISPDGKCLLLSIDMGEEHHRKDWDGPPPALWSFDLETQKAVRLTPKKLFAWDGCWLDDNNILFLSRNAGKKEPSIYRMSLGKNGKDRKLVIRHGSMPSVSK